MNQQEANEIERRLEVFNDANAKIQRMEKLLTMLDAFEKNAEHAIGMLLINPNTDYICYMAKAAVEDIETLRICSLTNDENTKFCEAFFQFAKAYVLGMKTEAQEIAGKS